jgi:hypothetical protein
MNIITVIQDSHSGKGSGKSQGKYTTDQILRGKGVSIHNMKHGENSGQKVNAGEILGKGKNVQGKSSAHFQLVQMSTSDHVFWSKVLRTNGGVEMPSLGS